MNLLIRIVCGLLGLLVFAVLILTVRGENTVIGRTLERVIPGYTQHYRICYTTPTIWVDATSSPPLYLGLDDAGADAASARNLEDWHTARVRITGRRWMGRGFWFATRHGVQTEISVEAAAIVSPETAGFDIDETLRDQIRAVALAGMRKDHPGHIWLTPEGLDTAPFSKFHRTEPRRTTEVLWEGYGMNIATLLALAVIVRAIWPGRSPARSVEPQ